MQRITARGLEVLRIMERTGEEIVCDGFLCYLDVDRIYKTVSALLSCMAVSDTSDTKGLTRYALNETGRAIIRRPELADEIMTYLLADAGAFTIENDRIRVL